MGQRDGLQPADHDGHLRFPAPEISDIRVEGLNSPELRISGKNLDLLVLSERPGATSEVFRTTWETSSTSDDRPRHGEPLLLKHATFDGWTIIGTGGDDRGPAGFELWHSGERMSDPAHKKHLVYAAPDHGSTWLELSDAKGEGHQTVGIERQIDTALGATYTLTLDLAGHLGYSAEYTRIGIYVDGVKIGGAEETSLTDALAWATRRFSFLGAGYAQTIRIVAEPTMRESNGRGMMIDDIVLIETLLPNTGREDAPVPLSAIGAALTDTDGSEVLTLTIEALPVGATLSDGIRSFTAIEGGTTANVTGWNLGNLSVLPPANFNGTLALQVVATATEQANSDVATTRAELRVTVLAVNDAPTALDASFNLTTGGSVRIDFATLIADVDGDVLTLSFGQPKYGTLTRNADGSYTYTPKRGYSGADQFVYTVSDGRASATATVSLTMVPRSIEDEDDAGHDYCWEGDSKQGRDDEEHENDGRTACITVCSKPGSAPASEDADVTRTDMDNQTLQVPTVDWSGSIPTRLSGLATRNEEWIADLLTIRPKEKSLAEKTGLVVRVEK